jgi:hypothetical protein
MKSLTNDLHNCSNNAHALSKIWMRSIIPTAHNSDSPLLRQPITPTAHFSDNATRELFTYLRSFFHSSACTLCSLSLLFYYIRPSSILNSPRFHAYCYLPSFCLSCASPGLHFFPSLLFSGSFVQ